MKTTSSPTFKYNSQDLHLGPEEVHVWCISLDDFLSQLQRLSQKLSVDEKKRADRFCFERDKKRYILSRGILREIISCYLEIEADQLEFSYGKYGKPALADNYCAKPLYFNVSHSEALALYAFTCDREVGIDIEHIRDIPELEQIIERFFSNTEKNVFRTLPESRKREAFFQGWTRKEAVLKAVGDGLSQPLDKFEVFVNQDESMINPMKKQEVQKNTLNWQIQDLPTVPGYAAAYAVKGASQLHCFHWPV